MGYLTETIEAVQRARHPLFQFSGGRDSLCTLFLLYESGCSNFDIVWVNTGDAALLRDRQDAFARAIARGVTDYALQ